MNGGMLDIPAAWEQIELGDLRGVLLVIGGVDVGKTTFAGYLYSRLKSAGRAVAYVDGDPGQSSYGPPGTLTLTSNPNYPDLASKGRSARRWFIGSTTPVGHMLAVLTGAQRLVQAASEARADTIVYDTSGFIDPAYGGLALKLAKIDLLRPGAVFAIQRDVDLEPLLTPLRRSRRTRVIDLAPSPAVVTRGVERRRLHRALLFARHFAEARPLTLHWSRLAVFPQPRFSLHGLLAFQDEQGFTLALGIVTEIDREARRITTLTPLLSLDGVDALCLGDLRVDPETFRDTML